MRFAFIAVFVSAAACTHATNRPAPHASDGSSATTITLSELLARGASGSAYSVIEQLRPWLSSRGPRRVAVSIDGSPPGDLGLLHAISVATVREIRLMRASSTVGQPRITRDGAVELIDVIVVTTRKDSRF